MSEQKPQTSPAFDQPDFTNHWQRYMDAQHALSKARDQLSDDMDNAHGRPGFPSSTSLRDQAIMNASVSTVEGFPQRKGSGRGGVDYSPHAVAKKFDVFEAALNQPGNAVVDLSPARNRDDDPFRPYVHSGEPVYRRRDFWSVSVSASESDYRSPDIDTFRVFNNEYRLTEFLRTGELNAAGLVQPTDVLLVGKEAISAYFAAMMQHAIPAVERGEKRRTPESMMIGKIAVLHGLLERKGVDVHSLNPAFESLIGQNKDHITDYVARTLRPALAGILYGERGVLGQHAREFNQDIFLDRTLLAVIALKQQDAVIRTLDLVEEQEESLDDAVQVRRYKLREKIEAVLA